jgi:hypothetical protein
VLGWELVLEPALEEVSALRLELVLELVPAREADIPYPLECTCSDLHCHLEMVIRGTRADRGGTSWVALSATL